MHAAMPQVVRLSRLSRSFALHPTEPRLSALLEGEPPGEPNQRNPVRLAGYHRIQDTVVLP